MLNLCSKNKGGDQLRGYHEADLRLCFRIYAKCWFSHDAAQICFTCLNLSCLVDAVTSVETDVGEKKVTVTSTLSQDELLEALQKTGKEVSFLGVKM